MPVLGFMQLTPDELNTEAWAQEHNVDEFALLLVTTSLILQVKTEAWTLECKCMDPEKWPKASKNATR